MQTFAYLRPATLPEVVDAASQPDTMVLAGGTELVNWMKEGIVAPDRIVDLNRLAGLTHIVVDDQGLHIGALSRMRDVAEHEEVQRFYPAVSQALLKSASAQIRNMATLGGNLLQRTRCPYFRADSELPCNKRLPGSGCSAVDGEDRSAAIFGSSDHCLATHPSDAAVALVALGAVVHVESAGGPRVFPLADLHRLPGNDPQRETTLGHGEIITSIVVPSSVVARRSCYLKVRERASFEFALVSAAVGIDVDAGHILEVRVALGGVAAKPWRLDAAEVALRGVALADDEALRNAVNVGFVDARPARQNGFKIELSKRAVVRALKTAAGVA